MRPALARAAVSALTVVALVPAPGAAREPATTELASVASDGTLGDGDSGEPALSADAALVAFSSIATTLAPDDGNGVGDVFVRDRARASTVLVSVAFDGGAANERSVSPSISDDGRLVAFSSLASNLVAGDANGTFDVFVRDLRAGVTTIASVSTDGAAGDARSIDPVVSADGRVVAFTSAATTLVPGDTNGAQDVFVRDLTTGRTERISRSRTGADAEGPSGSPALSADGALVAFVSTAGDLVADDTNGVADVFVHDRTTDETTRVSVAAGGGDANGASDAPAISPDGRFVAFASHATTIVEGDTNGAKDVFVHDRRTGETRRVSVDAWGAEAYGWSDAPSLSADGRFAAFHSYSSNLVPGDTNAWPDVFVHDLTSGITARVSVDDAGGQAPDGPSLTPVITPDGAAVAFWSRASTLVAGDGNDEWDVFVRARGDVTCPDDQRPEGPLSGPAAARAGDALDPAVCALVAARL